MAVLLNTSVLADLFHKFPHIDFNFYNTTVLFTPDDPRYQQALIFNGIYLLFSAVVIFLLFAMYFLVCSCYFCAKCKPQSLKPRPTRSRCLRFLIAFITVCSCFSLGLAFYGNNQTRDGVQEFADSADKMYSFYDLYQFKNNIVSYFVSLAITKGIDPLQESVSVLGQNISLPLKGLLEKIESSADVLKMNGNLLNDANVDLKSVSEDCIKYDNIRWWVTLSVLIWQLLLVLVIIYAAFSSQRRSPLIVLTIMAVLCLLLMLASVSLEVPLSVGAADLCKSPRKSLLQYVRKQPAKGLVLYYLDCTNSTNPLQQPYSDVQKQLQLAQQALNILKSNPIVKRVNASQVYIDVIQQSLTGGNKVVNELMKMLACDSVHKEFQDGMHAVCYTVLDGLGLLILTDLISSLLIIFILLCITPIWKAMTPLRPILKRDKYGVHLVTESYQGPPGGSESFHGSSSFDVSYKSIDDSEFEHLPLVSNNDQPPLYDSIHRSAEFLSVEEEDQLNNRKKGN